MISQEKPREAQNVLMYEATERGSRPCTVQAIWQRIRETAGAGLGGLHGAIPSEALHIT
jgi:hypothetical protein